MKINFYFCLFIYICILSSIASKKKGKNKIKDINKVYNDNTKNEYERIPSILEWAKKNNIYINENVTLNKNKDSDSSHNFFYFTSNSFIENNTLLLKVPYDAMLSQNTINKHFHDTKNRKWYFLWNQIADNKSGYIKDYTAKQILYISIIIENAINKKKGYIYNKYKPYLDMYEYINMDNFPIFYDEEERYFISHSGFGNELTKAIESLKEELYIINNELEIKTSISEDSFYKYRVLALANSINFNNTFLRRETNEKEYNESVVVPFIDCFKKVISKNLSTAEFSIKLDNNNKYYLEIRTIKEINKDEEIKLKWLNLSNQNALLYYGFTEEGNEFYPVYYINVFNNIFKRDLGIPTSNNFENIAKRDLYDLNSEFLEPDIVQSYKNISMVLDKYKDKKEGRYEMMLDNLNYYLRIYDEQFTDGNINLYIDGNQKRKNIREIMKLERKFVDNKMNYLRGLIKIIKEKKMIFDDGL